MKVGIVWAGNPNQKDDSSRSMQLHQLLPLSEVSGVEFHSLQFDEAADQLSIHRSGIGWIDPTESLYDFQDTAGYLLGLDLVITVDTAIAHLAGAMGIPVWVMLWKGHCWRYLESNSDSPWYPSMRLFRQSTVDDWGAVVNEIKTALIDEHQ